MNLSQPYYIEKRKGPNHISLDGKWNFTFAEATAEDISTLDFAHTATLPSSAYMNMFEAGLLPHPYKADNSKLYEDLDKKVWYYKKTFTLDSKVCPETQNAYLCFDGVAYYSRVWLNGELLGGHDGMFGGPVADVAHLLKKGENEIVVEAKAANFYREPDKKHYGKGFWGEDTTEIIPWNIAKDVDTSNGHFTVIGIWDSVRLEILNKTHLSRPYLVTESIEKKQDGKADATLSLEVSIASGKINELACLLSDRSYDYTFAYRNGLSGIPSDITVNITASVIDKDNGKTVFAEAEDFVLYDYDKSGIAEKMRECQFYNRSIDLHDVELWYPLGLGTQKLYEVKLELRAGNILVDEISFDTGIRKITVSQTTGRKYRQRWNDYRMNVNGRDFFIKGMNWMPIDFTYSFKDEEYTWILEQAKNCGIQLLRVWSGGGRPEDDRFYDFCNKNGILVWQDAFLANPARPKWNGSILENQLCYNLFRIRNNPSLAIYCGGNEHQAYHEDNNAAMYIIQRNVEDLDPTRPFYRVSPDGGSMHSYRDWEPVWYRKTYKDLPLMAECGIHSFPNAKSLRQLISKEEFEAPLDGIMEPGFREKFPLLINHFTEYRPDRIPRMLSRATHIDDVSHMNLTRLCEATQLAAFEFYQILAQSFRENYPVTAGLFPWVFKRSWTTTAIQMVDGMGETTAQYYAIKNSYAPTIIFASLCELNYAPGEKFDIPVRIINESGKTLDVRAELDIFTPGLEKMFNKSTELCVEADKYLSEAFTHTFAIPTEWCEKDFFVRASLWASKTGEYVSSSFYPLKCLERMADKSFRDNFRQNPAENLYLEKGPFIKKQISSAKKSVIDAKITKCRKNGERISLEIALCTSHPTYPVKLATTDDNTASYLSDNYFFMDGGEKKLVTMEIRNTGTPDRKLTLEISAWNSKTVSFEI